MSHLDRRNAATRPVQFSLESGALMRKDAESGAETRMPLETMRHVRLAVEMAGKTQQVVCRVTDADGQEFVFGSMRYSAPGVFEYSADTFQDLLYALHDELEPQGKTVDYVEGQSLSFMVAMFVLGLALAGLSLGFFVYLFLVEENPYGLFLLSGVAAGGWLLRVFRPRGPQAYDPARYRGKRETPAPSGDADEDADADIDEVEVEAEAETKAEKTDARETDTPDKSGTA